MDGYFWFDTRLISLSLEMLITKSPSTWTSRRNRRKLIGQIQRKHAGSIRVTEFPNSIKKRRHGRVFHGRGRHWSFSTARQATFIHSFIAAITVVAVTVNALSDDV
jgi:hypothetical protein